MANRQKAKGSTFEREVANDLTERYGEKFIRTPGSGAYVGGKNAVRRDFLHEGTIRIMKGDIIVPPDFGRLCIECKSYKGFPFHQLLQQGTVRQLEEWIEQLVDSADPDDIKLLFMKFNNVGKYVAAEADRTFRYHRGINYNSPKNDQWIFTGYTDFFDLNQELLQILAQPKLS